MTFIRHSQKGFTLVEGLLVVIALALIVGVGFYVVSANKTKTTSQTSQSSTTPTTAPSKTTTEPDPTADWTSYSSQTGKFSIKYPKSWARASTEEYCSNTAEYGVFLLGADSRSVGKCASESFGQIAITWQSGQPGCSDVDQETATQDSKQTLTIDGHSAVKIEATSKGADFGPDVDPAGTKSVQYCVTANNKTYLTKYRQADSFPDALSDFNTMVTKTLKFN